MGTQAQRWGVSPRLLTSSKVQRSQGPGFLLALSGVLWSLWFPFSRASSGAAVRKSTSRRPRKGTRGSRSSGELKINRSSASGAASRRPRSARTSAVQHPLFPVEFQSPRLNKAVLNSSQKGFKPSHPSPTFLSLLRGLWGSKGLQTCQLTFPTPAITGFLGGIAQDILTGFIRPVQELGLGQVPARQPVPSVSQVGCPPEKPHTRILRFIKMNTGVSIKLSRAKSLIRELGLENAARCLGVTAGEVCSLLIVASPRRRRGISASDIRIVKRTARRFENLKHDLGHLSRPHHKRRHTAHAHK